MAFIGTHGFTSLWKTFPNSLLGSSGLIQQVGALRDRHTAGWLAELGNQGITSGFFPNPVYSQYIYNDMQHLSTFLRAYRSVWGIVNNICKGRGMYIGDKWKQKLKKKKTQKKGKSRVTQSVSVWCWSSSHEWLWWPIGWGWKGGGGGGMPGWRDHAEWGFGPAKPKAERNALGISLVLKWLV
jgi:hypothetical protein